MGIVRVRDGVRGTVNGRNSRICGGGRVDRGVVVVLGNMGLSVARSINGQNGWRGWIRESKASPSSGN